ncbi:MAG: 6-phosphogluconolactonase [Candidatus Latescibacterota bacterium]
MNCTKVSYTDSEALSMAAADYITESALESVRQRGRFTLVLSGGNTPKHVYRRLASPPYSETMPWESTHLFWSDERCVPPESPESNFGMAREILLRHEPAPPGNIHRIPAETGAPHAARLYEDEIRRFFLSGGEGKDWLPVFDCVILGIGADGHIASLFPGSWTLRTRERPVLPATAPEGISPRDRVTMTLPVINRARRVLFLVSGSEKKDVIRTLVHPSRPAANLPAAMVTPVGDCRLYLDFEV